MAFIDILRFGSPKAQLPQTPAVTMRKQSEKVTRATISVAPASPKVVPLRQPKPPQVYKSISDLPPYSEIASLSGKKFEIGPKSQESIVILKLIDDKENKYSILATKDAYGGAVYKGLLQRLTKADCEVFACGVTDGALINRLNQEGSESVLNDSTDKRIVRDIDKLATDAIEQGASDIHIEKRGGSAVVKMRVNGRLVVYSDSWAADYVDTMARALHTLADDESKDQTFTETGQMSVMRNLSVGAVKLRVQISQAYPDGGLDIVMRVLRVAVSAKVQSLNELGYAAEHIEMMEYMRSSPTGLVIIAGTTGSGKTTTLQTLMQEIRRMDSGIKMISIEDPPEYVMDGVTQIPVARRRNQAADENPFAQAMRSTMRMDPNVIMIGEIRDSESAELMVGMNQSGHKVFGSIHADSPLGVIGRLNSMGVPGSVLAANKFISGLIYQTLVPLLCPSCKVDYDETSDKISPALHERIKKITYPGDTIFFEKLGGCPHCRNQGIIGRTVCAEMVIPDDTIRRFISEGQLGKAYEHWRSQRMGKPATSMAGATALEHGIMKMRRGEVSPLSIESELGLLHDFRLDIGSASTEVAQLLGFEN
ncbi:hypothetical protein CBP36_19940 (plasmid) [Acidovorax carolinensis]|uniref:AAA+ ATPase domain-containing protein n=1 Tax=Acidovorax carolinensis TaxID=553814 RepID=A0A240UJP2_9BURK|nr:ATPase, T2SS/T4P/T4SS family [Acidovorax carolinensis]ART57182.1 hypothetical protein CBP35_19910 [Acidovorax carolinensis]ART61240.1 hypothetical protein CBP36_19940 [Acidovorax carolinensis]